MYLADREEDDADTIAAILCIEEYKELEQFIEYLCLCNYTDADFSFGPSRLDHSVQEIWASHDNVYSKEFNGKVPLWYINCFKHELHIVREFFEIHNEKDN